jgi:hypothetical protein
MILEIKSEFTLKPSISEYYPEKYFRFLANNYDSISQGDTWTTIGTEQGIGFEANEDFGSFLLVKDWSMYSFKLRKVVFRPYCSYNLNDNEGNNFCDAEMLLYHTIDNNYYPPGRRIHLGINYLVISVPFKKSTLMNPANDKLFQFLQLDMLKEIVSRNQSINNVFPKISPFKPIKLYQIIQHQPSYLFENELIPESGIRSLYLVFAKFHYISELDYNNLNNIYTKQFGSGFNKSALYLKDSSSITGISDTNIYRNWENPNELEPTATLMAYNRGFYIHFSAVLLFITIAVLI